MTYAIGGTPQHEHSKATLQRFSDNLKLPTPCSSELLSVESMILQNDLKFHMSSDAVSDQVGRKIQRVNFLFPMKGKLNSSILQNKDLQPSYSNLGTTNLAITANTAHEIQSLDFQKIPAFKPINLEQVACEKRKVVLSQMAAKNEVLFQVKKDALWKPLLRQFRRYIKLQVIKNYGRSKKVALPGKEPEQIGKNPAYTDSDLDLSVDIVFTNIDVGNEKAQDSDHQSIADNSAEPK